MAKTADSPAMTEMKRRRDEYRKNIDESLRRMEEAKPTPTEEEMQQVMMNIASGQGANLDLEDTAEPEQAGVNQPVDAPVVENRVATADTSTSSASYQTRDVSAATSSTDDVKRGPGRPRKTE